MAIYKEPRNKTLSGREVAQHAYNAGFKGEDLVIAVAVAKSESSWNAHAVGDDTREKVGAKWEQGEQSTGLWQIHYRPSRDKGNPLRDPNRMFDPALNATTARSLQNSKSGWGHWTMYNNGHYKQNMDAARAAAKAIDTTVPASTGPTSTTATGEVGATGPESGEPFTEAIIVDNPSDLIPLSLPRSNAYTYKPGGQKDNLSLRFAGGSVDFSTEEATQVTLNFIDHDFDLLKSGGPTELGARWRLFKNNQNYSVMSVETYHGAGGPHIQIRLQPFAVAHLKMTVGKGIRSLSASSYVREMAKQTQMLFVGEETATRAEIVPLTVEVPVYPGSTRMKKRGENPWEMARRFAEEEGYYFFESGNTLYFCSAPFLRNALGSGKIPTKYIAYGWNVPPHKEFGKPLLAVETPRCNGSSGIGEASPSNAGSKNFWQPTIDVKVDKDGGGTDVRAGMGLFLGGVPRFSGGGRLITRVSWNLDDKASAVSIQANGLADLAATRPGGVDPINDLGGVPMGALGPVDTSARAGTPGKRLNTAERNQLFGPHGNDEAGQRPNMTTVKTPWGLSVSVNVLCAQRFLDACMDAHANSSWKPLRIDSYAGRPIRGSSEWSLHSWALAWDFFNRPYPQQVDVWGPTNAPSKDFYDIFEQHGFKAGAYFSNRKDYPHIEWPYAPPTISKPPKTPTTAPSVV